MLEFFKDLGDGCPWIENWRSGYDVGKKAYFEYSSVVLFDLKKHTNMFVCMTKKKKNPPQNKIEQKDKQLNP